MISQKINPLAIWFFIAWIFGATDLAAREIDASSDLCASIHQLEPGEELVLQPGDYRGPCKIRRGGKTNQPIVVRAANPSHKPRIIYDGSTSNVLEIYASHLTLKGLEIGPTQAGVDAIRIFTGTDLTIEDCLFKRVGGISLAATHGNIQRVVIRGNTILENRTTAVYLGCHDGHPCLATDIVFERNFIQRVEAPQPQIGYGIQIKLNSTATIRDNVIIDTKGPPIMVYGSRDPTGVNILEGNFVGGSRTSSGIVVGGGPAVIRNNISVTNALAGIALQDYDRRGLMRGIFVTHNTVYENHRGGILAPRQIVKNSEIVFNTSVTRAGSEAFPLAEPGLRVASNIDCTGKKCFIDAEGRDFSPSDGSPLLSIGKSADSQWRPAVDFFGHHRGPAIVAGAVISPGKPVALGIKE